MQHAELGDRAEELLADAPKRDRSAWRRSLEINGTELAAMTRCEVDEDLERRLAAVVWSCVAEPGDIVAGNLVEALGVVPAARILLSVDPLQTFRRALRPGHLGGGGDEPGAQSVDGGRRLEAALSRWLPRATFDRIRDLIRAGVQTCARVITPDDPEWPGALGDLGPGAPHAFWVRGSRSLAAFEAVGARAVSIVGARAATEYGQNAAIDLAHGLAREGLTIVSGGAYGIDIAAHRAALAGEWPTIAVLAGGVDRLYPRGNEADLRRIMANGGAVVSELPCGQSPTRGRFLQRNRLIAAMADATIVVEAGWRSGALNTAAHASEIGRPVGAVPGPITSASSVGCHRLIREYDATLITSVDDALELMRGFDVAEPTLPGLEVGEGSDRSGVVGGAAARVDGHTLTGEAVRVWEALSSRGRQTASELAERAGVAESVVRGALGMLEIDGRASNDAGRWRRIAS